MHRMHRCLFILVAYAYRSLNSSIMKASIQLFTVINCLGSAMPFRYGLALDRLEVSLCQSKSYHQTNHPNMIIYPLTY